MALSEHCSGVFREWIVKHDRFVAGYIVNMIRLDYFDEAIGVTEGFTIFEDLLRFGEVNFIFYPFSVFMCTGRCIENEDIAP